jgi:hypothetical protein
MDRSRVAREGRRAAFVSMLLRVALTENILVHFIHQGLSDFRVGYERDAAAGCDWRRGGS